MATDIEVIRLYIADPILYSVAQAGGDDIVTEFMFPNAPIYPGTSRVYVDGLLQLGGYTADEVFGIFLFSTAPSKGSSVQIAAKHTLLSDADIQAVLDLYAGADHALKLAAADCLDIIASNEAMIMKRIRNLDLDIDGPAVADSLRDHARNLREQVKDAGELEGSSWDLAEQIYDGHGYAEKIAKDSLREG